MESEKIINKLNRSSFFALTGKSILALLALKFVPFSFSKNEEKKKEKINVRINTFAVQRNNRGEKHV